MYDAPSKICQPGAKQLLESRETPSSGGAHVRVLSYGARMASEEGSGNTARVILSMGPSYSSEAVKVAACSPCEQQKGREVVAPSLSCPKEARAPSGSLLLTGINSQRVC